LFLKKTCKNWGGGKLENKILFFNLYFMGEQRPQRDFFTEGFSADDYDVLKFSLGNEQSALENFRYSGFSLESPVGKRLIGKLDKMIDQGYVKINVIEGDKRCVITDKGRALLKDWIGTSD